MLNVVTILFYSFFSLAAPDVPELKIEGRSALNKPLVFSAMNLHEQKRNECHLFILTPKGQTDFYRKLDKICFDFRPLRIEGKNFYSYIEVNEIIRYAGYAGYVGPRVILDDKFHEVKRVAHENEMHEFHLLGLDHWIGFEIELGRLINGKPFMNKRLRERKNGEILFDWGTSDIIAQFGTEAATNMFQTTFRNETAAEIFHLNSIQILKDGFLVGMGHDGVGYILTGKRKNYFGFWEGFTIVSISPCTFPLCLTTLPTLTRRPEFFTSFPIDHYKELTSRTRVFCAMNSTSKIKN